ncbi:MAG: glycosyltransferase family 4 protein [Thermodesulfobacteriota bacterium]
MIKILHVSATSTGGVGLNLLLLAKNMDPAAFELSFALPDDSHFFREISGTGVKVYRLPISRSPLKAGNIKCYREIKRLMGLNKYDIVHSHTSVGGFLGRIAAASLGLPAIWSIHGWAFNYPRGSRLYRKALFMLESFIDRYTTHYVAVCENMRDIGLENGICSADKVTVIYNCVDAGSINEGAIDLRAELNVPSNVTIVGAVGRFEEQKDFNTFLEAAAIIKERRAEVKFLIVGEGPLRPQIEARISSLGLVDDVILTGWKTNVADYMKTMDIFCLSSKWEAMPFIVLEAMAMGKPIVATEVGGVGEVLRDEGADFLLQPEDPKGFAGAVTRLIEDKELRTKLGKANRVKIEKNFNLEGMINSYEKLYKDILA